MKTVSSGSTSHLFQAVLAEFLVGSGYENQLRKTRRVLAQRIARMSDVVASHFPPGCLLSEPQGGYVLWVQMPAEVDALLLHQHAIAQGIAFMPGPLFSASGKFSNCLRLNCGNAWSPAIESAVIALGTLARRYGS